MTTIKMKEWVEGGFAGNKDLASKIKADEIIPALNRGEDVIIDFEQVNSATQSFVHALISEVIRNFGIDVLDKISFKNCNPVVKWIINIVVDYMQDFRQNNEQ